jgi:hypothetical protein
MISTDMTASFVELSFEIERVQNADYADRIWLSSVFLNSFKIAQLARMGCSAVMRQKMTVGKEQRKPPARTSGKPPSRSSGRPSSINAFSRKAAIVVTIVWLVRHFPVRLSAVVPELR